MASKLRVCALVIMCTLGIVSCRTTVPEPTMPVENTKHPLPVYSMHNIGPVTVQNSFSTRYADVNQDGNVDLLVGLRKPDAGFRIEWGDGHGNWTTQPGPKTTLEPRSFSVADANHNGNMDILIGGQGDQQGLQVWELQPSDKWILEAAPTESGYFRDVAFADVNNDGWPDIVAVRVDSATDGGIYVWLNNGRGGWVPHAGPLLAGIYTGLAVADLNGDGNLDIIASRRGGVAAKHVDKGSYRVVGGVQIWYGDGTGRWEPENLPAESDAESVTVADINGDGHLDIVAGLYQQGIELWMGTGDARNAWSKRMVTNQGTWSSVRVGDLDRNGKRELVASSSDGRGIWLWSWTGDIDTRPSGFTRLTGYLPDHGTYYNLDLGDVHNNGTLDVASLREDGAVQVWSFKEPPQLPPEEFIGMPIGKPLQVFFDTAKTDIRPGDSKALSTWMASLKQDPKGLYFRVLGKADIRPIHTVVFPNNVALSQGRAEAVASLLRAQGIPSGRIFLKALGDKDPTPIGMTKQALQQNRTVWVQAFPPISVRLPHTTGIAVKRDLFHITENTAFKTINGIPEYRVGPSDGLTITMWQGGQPDIHKVLVDVDGTISLPYFEGVKVNGLTPSEIDTKLTKILSRFVRHPRVDVIVTKYHSKIATIFGQVKDLIRQPTGPGPYFLYGKESIVDFISRAGGPTDKADMTKVQLIRNGKVIRLNLERAIQQADWRENAIVNEGDTIFIPSLEQAGHRVYVLGEVNKPGIVEFTGKFTILDAISKAGGFKEDAFYPDIRVLRANRDKPVIMPVAFNRLLEKGDLTQNLSLYDRDVIIVPRSPIGNWNEFIKQITPSLDVLLFKPLTAVSEMQSIVYVNKALSRL